MVLSQLRVTPRPQAMKFKDRTPFRVDQVQLARLELVQAYRKFKNLVGPEQAKKVTGQIVVTVALEDQIK